MINNILRSMPGPSHSYLTANRIPTYNGAIPRGREPLYEHEANSLIELRSEAVRDAHALNTGRLDPRNSLACPWIIDIADTLFELRNRLTLSRELAIEGMAIVLRETAAFEPTPQRHRHLDTLMRAIGDRPGNDERFLEELERIERYDTPLPDHVLQYARVSNAIETDDGILIRIAAEKGATVHRANITINPETHRDDGHIPVRPMIFARHDTRMPSIGERLIAHSLEPWLEKMRRGFEQRRFVLIDPELIDA